MSYYRSRLFAFFVGQYLEPDESRARYIPIRHNTLSDGDVKDCGTTVADSGSGL